jgi:hypothetical protein
MVNLEYKPVISIHDTSLDIHAKDLQEELSTVQIGSKKEPKSKFHAVKSTRGSEGAVTVENCSDKGDSPSPLLRKRSNHTSNTR